MSEEAPAVEVDVTPAVMPQQVPPPPEPVEDDDLDDDERKPADYDKALEHARKLRSEARRLRERLKEAEPIIKAHKEAEEASKTEIQRAQEAREAAEHRLAEMQTGYDRLELASKYGIPTDKAGLIGSGSREQMESNAAQLAELVSAVGTPAPPPSHRPVEGLRPGASPESPKQADDSYPAAWAPAHVRTNERSHHGQ